MTNMKAKREHIQSYPINKPRIFHQRSKQMLQTMALDKRSKHRNHILVKSNTNRATINEKETILAFSKKYRALH